MHNALLITEIRSFILKFLVADTAPRQGKPRSLADCDWIPRDTRRAGRRALLALARTCRALSEPALDALWYRLHSLEPLLRCVRTREDVADESFAPYSEEEWNIVLRYAPRIQELTLSHADTLSIKILHALWSHTTLLLPNLRKLEWDYQDTTQITTIYLLLSPSLVDLSVWVDDSDHISALGFLERYHTISPNIKSLQLSYLYPKSPPLTITTMSHSIPRCLNLEVLHCLDIEEDTIVHLIQSPRLKKFSARLRNHCLDNLGRLAASHPFPFQNLRVLNLYVESISSITPYLRSTHQPLEEVRLQFFFAFPSDFHEFFLALNSTTRQRTLRHIQLIYSGLQETDIMQLDLELLSPLSAFSLRTLHVNTGNRTCLNDEELLQLVQAWPELETLHLNPCTTATSSHPPSLRGLLLLLAHCPQLHTLRLCVDARTIPVLTAEESTIRNVLIKKLDLGNSLIAQSVTEGVANFLVDHFPSLSGLTLWNTYTHLYATERSMWSEVNGLIEAVRGQNTGGLGDSDSEMDVDRV